jgi:hypothetical protein
MEKDDFSRNPRRERPSMQLFHFRISGAQSAYRRFAATRSNVSEVRFEINALSKLEFRYQQKPINPND